MPGPSGQDFVRAALAQNYRITIYARNASKLDQDLADKVDVIAGQLDDREGLEKAAKCGATVFVSFAGPAKGNQGTPVTDGLKQLYPLLLENGFKRVLVLSTPSYTVPEDKGGLKWKGVVMLIKLIGGSAYEEITSFSALTASQPVDRLKWTIFRVPFLTNGAVADVTAGYTGDGNDSLTLSRKSMAKWVVQEIQDEKWVGKAPFLSN